MPPARAAKASSARASSALRPPRVIADNPPAVILGGTTNAVSVARSLAAAGIRVHALGTGSWDPVRLSRSCASYLAVEKGRRVQARWLDWLERGAHGAVLLPCNDDGVELIARNRTRLVELGYRPFEANDDVLLTMLDKQKTYALARAIGIATPRTVATSDRERVRDAAAEFGFPCALKPSHSHHFARRFRSKAFVLRDFAELEQALDRTASAGLKMVLTEIIAGGDDRLASYYSYLDEGGEPLLRFTKRKIRQYPPGFGRGCYEATTWDDEVAEIGLRFFRGIGLRGLANVEFKRDARDGELKLVECNHRFTMSNELLRIAGLDVALFSYNRLVGRPTPPTDSCREGVYFWHPIEDVRSFLSLRRSDDLTLSAWARSLLHRQHFPVFRWDDPKPTLANISRASRLLRPKVSAGATPDGRDGRSAPIGDAAPD